jgi:hypothetical protein
MIATMKTDPISRCGTYNQDDPSTDPIHRIGITVSTETIYHVLTIIGTTTAGSA